jgi:hypothetical protein
LAITAFQLNVSGQPSREPLVALLHCEAARTGIRKELWMITGSCLCGTIRYEIRGELGPIVLCHCTQCRKAQGSAFASNTAVKATDFVIVAGAEALAAYESSPGKKRHFCRRCGSPIISTRDAVPGVVRVRIGTLDSPVETPPSAHIFVEFKAAWDEIRDGRPQYAGLEPSRPRTD